MFWLNLTIGSVSESKVLSKHQLADVEDVLESANDLDNHFISLQGFTGGDALAHQISNFIFEIFSNQLISQQAKSVRHGNCAFLISYCIWRI